MGLLPVLVCVVLGVYNVHSIMYNDLAVPAMIQKAIALGVTDVQNKNQFEEHLFQRGE